MFTHPLKHPLTQLLFAFWLIYNLPITASCFKGFLLPWGFVHDRRATVHRTVLAENEDKHDNCVKGKKKLLKMMFLNCCDSVVKIENSNSQVALYEGCRIIIGGKFVLIHHTPTQIHPVSSRLSFRLELFPRTWQPIRRKREVNRWEWRSEKDW